MTFAGECGNSLACTSKDVVSESCGFYNRHSVVTFSLIPNYDNYLVITGIDTMAGHYGVTISVDTD